MRIKNLFLLIGLLFLICGVRFQHATAARDSSIDTDLAHRYFQEARAICERDKGNLWGVALCGPMLFVDPRTRDLVANQSDEKGLLTRKGEVFTGRLPDEENCANTAVVWAGVKWTMIVWPLPEDEGDRARLMLHECFHRIQDDLGLPAANPSNDHLDSLEGRIWLQMEWRALREALWKSDRQARRRAIEDALIFRAYRRSLFPKADALERALEMNEGLAEYTGLKLGAGPIEKLTERACVSLEQARNRPTFVRSFAYVSGPAYGILLDASSTDWRKGLKPQNDLGELLRRAHAIKLPAVPKAAAEERAKNYNGDGLRLTEVERDNARRERIAGYRARLVEGRVLSLPLTDKVNYSFNPNNLVPLDDLGTVYPTLRVTDEWGILEVSNGALMAREDGRVTKVCVPAPGDVAARSLKGDGWTLELNQGWTVAAGPRKGDFVLKKAE
ncbi:MAG: hypothetical protein L0229_26450 [Blastocatellia bacterium]|nr:hypothetical protein [Blastocatellia bacterium]